MARTYDPCAPEPILLWDTVWDCDTGDWQIADDGALRDDAALHTAIILCLFTDKRALDDDTLPHDVDDRRGWWGDYIDLDEEAGERELGSRLWLYERSILNDETREGIEDAVNECLQPLIDTGLVATFDVTVTLARSAQSVEIGIQAYSEAGTLRYDQKFQRVWQQVHAGA